MSQFTDDYLRGLGMSAHNNALAYGYSVTVTASFGILTQTAKPVSIGRIFLFVIGAGSGWFWAAGGAAFFVVRPWLPWRFYRKLDEASRASVQP